MELWNNLDKAKKGPNGSHLVNSVLNWLNDAYKHHSVSIR